MGASHSKRFFSGSFPFCFLVELPDGANIAELKSRIRSLRGIPEERQEIYGAGDHLRHAAALENEDFLPASGSEPLMLVILLKGGCEVGCRLCGAGCDICCTIS